MGVRLYIRRDQASTRNDKQRQDKPKGRTAHR